MAFFWYNTVIDCSTVISSKKQKKIEQQKLWGMVVSAQIPLVLIQDEIDAHIHQILKQIIDGITAIGIQLAVVTPKDEERLADWKHFAEKYPKWIKLIPRSESKSDIFDLTVLDGVSTETLRDLRDQKMVPIAEKGVRTFDPVLEKGNGFLFHCSPWSLFAAFVRAQETYRFPYDWDNLIKAAGR